jgi:hypothetical protein
LVDLKKTLNSQTHDLELAKKETDYLRKIIKLMEEKAELIHQMEIKEYQ